MVQSARTQHRTPQARGSVLQEGPPPSTADTRPRPQAVTRLEVPTASSLVSVNLLEQLAELRKTLVFIEGYDKG